jgi:hypothetical protein
MNTTILDRDRLSVLSGALVLGLALGRFLEAPSRSLALDVLGSPLGINLSATTVMLLLSLGLGATAVESLVRSHPLARQGELLRSVIHWLMPALLVLGLAGWLLDFEAVGVWTAGIVVRMVSPSVHRWASGKQGGFYRALARAFEPPAKEKLDRFYELVRTPVEEGECAPTEPCVLPEGITPAPRKMLIEKGGLEIPAPMKVSIIGFAASWGAVILMIVGFWWLTR